jgi:hypothetical protein
VRTRISVDTLSERPNLRVRVDPACVRFTREAEDRVAGAAFLGVPFLCRERKGAKKGFLISGCRIGVRHDRLVVDTLRESTLRTKTFRAVREFRGLIF